MSFWEILLIALALAMDALAVSVGLGLSTKGSLLRCAARAAAAFGLFQAGMVLAGWLAGGTVTGRVGEAGNWVAAGVLSVVGLRMLVEAVRKRPASVGGDGREGEGPPPRRPDDTTSFNRDGQDMQDRERETSCLSCPSLLKAVVVPAGRDASTGWTLLALAIATSLDALGAGLGLAILGAEIGLAAAVIGLVAAALSAAGVMLAGRLARGASGALSRMAEMAGAVVLLGIAAKIALGGG